VSWLDAVTPEGADPAVVRRVLALAASGGAGADRQRRTAQELVDAHGDAEPSALLAALSRGRPRGGSAVMADAATAGRLLAACEARVLVAGQPGYPARLSALGPELGAPLWLFATGLLGEAPAVAIVGSRNPSWDGLEVAGDLSRYLARQGVTVVSGLARGIDEAAHRGALDGGGRTIAVLGTGFGVDYPRGREALRSEIAGSGALVTELLPGIGPRPVQFLCRNRIIAALADAVVVVEGRARSGALATARMAAEQGRDVWAVPGSIRQPTAQAPLALLRDGARPLTRLDDVLDSLPLPAPHPKPPAWRPGTNAAGIGEDRRERSGGRARPGSQGSAPRTAPTVPAGPASVVAGVLSAVPASADALRAATGLALPTVLAALAELSARGHARTTPRGWVSGSAG
jgi:DNA processing protein